MTYCAHVAQLFRQHGDPDIALGQMAYMRHQFEFFGLKMPAWTALAKQVHAERGIPQGEELKSLARQCFADEHREMHYFALQTVEKALKKQPEDFIEFLEELILTQSWWDTVDWINKLVGQHFRRFPQLAAPVTERWAESGNIWLQRVSMIFQLSYRDKTDAALLFDRVRRQSRSKEFFLQKGAGWALRQYAKTDPDAVRQFVDATPLSPLTRREALKAIRAEE
ncbi:MAG TPA: DNA alkylation repair protein [Saprospiraceae bacterium]|nr:DNA alkylation repair protein [Saprospiraceae bacterium]HND86823.1 DNA alkylation repair protein [Saprospiraceae bacterium]HNG90390.1 DNA alkylation repair protein [Saprospiraceae bacterium]